MRADLPTPKSAFTDCEALDLLAQYRRDPSSLTCPRCEERGAMEVLAFIEPEVDEDGLATMCSPEGKYAAAVYCHGCGSAIGILVGDTV